MKETDGKDMNVPSKTPEEIKKGLNVLYPPSVNTTYEEYVKAISCIPDALAYIQKLENGMDEWALVAASPGAVEDMAREYDRLSERAKQLERERDAAVEQLKYFNCRTCVHSNLMHIASECCGCKNANRWEWRGVKEE